MTTLIKQRLESAGLTIPPAPKPAGSYVPFVRIDSMLFVSGQLCFRDNELITGRLGDDLSVEEGNVAARYCALNLLAIVQSACDGNLGRVEQVVRLGGFVCCTGDFFDHPKVINGASDLMLYLFGERGRHARTAVSCPTLPLGAAVEIDGIFRVN